MLLTLPELAASFRLSVATLAEYEAAGLIEPALTGTFPLYGGEARLRLEIIAKARRLGFGLSEIKALIDAQAASGSRCEGA